MNKIKDETPSKEARQAVTGGDTYRHDAFATINMSVITGGHSTLFGSDLKHDQRIRISIQRATLDRNLCNDWIHGSGQPTNHLVTFEMSHTQFAQFITSNGNGSGTPVTLRYAAAPGTPIQEMPGIKNIESKSEVFKREIKDSAKKQLQSLQEGVDRLGAMFESGKVSIKEAREIHKNLTIQMGNLPSNMAFVVDQAEEALEAAQMAAKIDVEAYIDHAARRIGLDNLGQLGIRLETSQAPSNLTSNVVSEG